mgnify:FL=1
MAWQTGGLVEIKDRAQIAEGTDSYPTDADLDAIEAWDLQEQGVEGFVTLLRDMWRYDGFKLTGKRVLNLQLHTAGWSGNEDVIKALQGTMFWTLYWTRSNRGGHYYFRIDQRT